MKKLKPTSKLICMGCLTETPINGVIDGKKYRKNCPTCREHKNHVAREMGFKVDGFAPKTRLDETDRSLVPSIFADTTSVAYPTRHHKVQ